MEEEDYHMYTVQNLVILLLNWSEWMEEDYHHTYTGTKSGNPPRLFWLTEEEDYHVVSLCSNSIIKKKIILYYIIILLLLICYN
jgi:hypothetical protein